jgi:hypothetical protein
MAPSCRRPGGHWLEINRKPYQQRSDVSGLINCTAAFLITDIGAGGMDLQMIIGKSSSPTARNTTRSNGMLSADRNYSE